MIKKLMKEDENGFVNQSTHVSVEKLTEWFNVGGYDISLGKIKGKEEYIILENNNDSCWEITDSFKKWVKEKSPEFYRTLKLTLIENE